MLREQPGNREDTYITLLMKKSTLLGILAALLAAVSNAGASLYSVGGIPVASPLGASFTGAYDQAPVGATVGSLTVDLNLSGGYNGNLYAYLVAPNGTLVTLLNQPGVTGGNPYGYSGSGLNVTLSDSATGGIDSTPETAGAVLNGTYQAAGALSGFNGSAADGTWTLFFADLGQGGGQPTLTGWSLDITAVPEPAPVALAVFGGILGLVALRRFISGGSSRSALEVVCGPGERARLAARGEVGFSITTTAP